MNRRAWRRTILIRSALDRATSSSEEKRGGKVETEKLSQGSQPRGWARAKCPRLLRLSLSMCFLVVASAAHAQTSGTRQMRQRYDKTTSTSVDDAIKQLNSDDHEKRLAAVKVLGATKDPKVVESLSKAVGDADVRVQAKAITILGDLRATDATLILTQYLFLRATDPQMKQLVLTSLGMIGDTRAVRPIIEFLQRDLDPATRGTAVFALGEIGSAESAQTLSQIARADSDATVRRLAGEAARKVDVHPAVTDNEVKATPEIFPRPKAAQPPPQK